ncbi:MAG: hypothetical protein H5U36_07430 [Candidatus Caldatribacterium sp.]|nr:hypothetical protein [Candidatus Caldatribacterium sp.]
MSWAFRELGHKVVLLSSTSLQPYNHASARGRLRSIARCLPWWTKDFVELTLQWLLACMARRALARESYDLVFHRASIYDFAGAYLAKVARIPLIAYLDAPFAIERRSKEYYVQLGIPEEKILVLPNGISSRFLEFDLKLSEDRPPFSSDPKTCTIGFVGSLSPWHRVDLLLHALSKLDDRFQVMICGSWCRV